MDIKQLLTNSRRASYNDCPRKHYYAYELNRRPVRVSDALKFGSLIHGCLELWWGHPAGMAAVVDYLIDSERTAGQDPFEVAKARALMECYDIKYSGLRVYGMIMVEAAYTAPLVNPRTGGTSRNWELAGKIDVIVKNVKTGKYGIIEHKTTSSGIEPESAYWSRLLMDGQISGYYTGANVLGYPCDFCVYDVIHKPALKPYKATPTDKLKTNKDGSLSKTNRLADETPEEYYARVLDDIKADPDKYLTRRDVVRLDAEMVDYFYDMSATAMAIREAQVGQAKSGIHAWPRNPQACDRYGQCEYFNVCTGCVSIDDNREFVTSGPNPELA